MTRRFASAGHPVIAAGRRQDRLEALALELGRDRVHPVVLDVRDRDAVGAAIAQLPPQLAGIDLPDQ